ncbi:MAG: hypothetical protein HRU20_28960, partial [Pseudomonadales bacterium]|nr:hypothetical protein [Pseudomonadales bacterium]
MWNNREDVDVGPASSEAIGIPVSERLLPDEFLSPFEHDLFLGTRFTMNNVDSTDFIAGVIYDINKGTSIASFEGGT